MVKRGVFIALSIDHYLNIACWRSTVAKALADRQPDLPSEVIVIAFAFPLLVIARSIATRQTRNIGLINIIYLPINKMCAKYITFTF